MLHAKGAARRPIPVTPKRGPAKCGVALRARRRAWVSAWRDCAVRPDREGSTDGALAHGQDTCRSRGKRRKNHLSGHR